MTGTNWTGVLVHRTSNSMRRCFGCYISWFLTVPHQHHRKRVGPVLININQLCAISLARFRGVCKGETVCPVAGTWFNTLFIKFVGVWSIFPSAWRVPRLLQRSNNANTLFMMFPGECFGAPHGYAGKMKLSLTRSARALGFEVVRGFWGREGCCISFGKKNEKKKNKIPLSHILSRLINGH